MSANNNSKAGSLTLQVLESSVETRKSLVMGEAFEVVCQIVVCSASVEFEFLVEVHIFKT